MEKTNPPKREFSSYFFEKDEFIESTIRKEYWYLLDIALQNVDLTPKNRFSTITRIAVFLLGTAFYLPLLAYTTYLLRSDLSLFTNSLHYTLLLFFSLFLFIQITLNMRYVFEAHYRHANNFYDYEEGPCSAVDALKKEMEKEKKAMIVMPVFVIIIGALLFAANFIDDYFGATKDEFLNEVNLKLIVPLYLPYDSSHGLQYIAATVTMMPVLFYTTATIAGGIFLYTVNMQRLVLQMKILRSSVERIEERSRQLFMKHNPSSDKKNSAFNDHESMDFFVCSCLKQNIIHYQVIRRFFFIINTAVGDIMFMAFAVGSLVISLSMISISKGGSTYGNTITVVAMCSAEVGIMFLLCFYGESLVSESEILYTDLYRIDWFNYSKELNRMMFTFKETIKEPMVITAAGGMVKVRLDTFKTIINSSYSFFNCLNAFEKKT